MYFVVEEFPQADGSTIKSVKLDPRTKKDIRNAMIYFGVLGGSVAAIVTMRRMELDEKSDSDE